MSKILILCNHYAVCSGRYMRDAFQRIGCDVRTMGTSMGNKIWGGEVNPGYVWEPNYNLDDEWLPDLVILMDSAIEYANSVYIGIPHIVCGVDNHVRDYSKLGKFDHYFLAHHDGPCQPVDDGRDDMTWLPCAYDPIFFTPSHIPLLDRQYDVCMIGVPYQSRMEIVERMSSEGIKIFAGVGALYEDYASRYHSSRISLCLSAAGDVAQRIFETAAMGCVVLTDDCADLGRLGFHHMLQGAIYKDTDDAVRLANLILGSPEMVRSLANAGQEWAQPHTWDARAKTILERMKLA